jgi:hypothetical protein
MAGRLLRCHRPFTALTVLGLCALVAGCGGGGGGSPPGATTPWRTVSDARHGLSFQLPSGWQRAHVNLTPHLVDPREELSVGTFPLRYRPGGPCAQFPVSALEDLGPRDAFMTIQERGRGSAAGFPPRPRHFGPGLGGPAEAPGCVPGKSFTNHWFTFADGGRHFHVLVVFGPDARKAVERQAWRILDSLKIDPAVQPSWKGSP